jgi:hypothetical protein
LVVFSKLANPSIRTSVPGGRRAMKLASSELAARRELLLGRGEALVAALLEAEPGSSNWKKQLSRSGLRVVGEVQVTVNGTVAPARATEIRARPPLTVTGLPLAVTLTCSAGEINKVALFSSWLSIAIERSSGTVGSVPKLTR